MERYRNKYRSDSIRIRNWDYGSPGYYYVTICTAERIHYFGDVVMGDNDLEGERPWESACGGIAGTHNYASLPPAAHPAHVPVHGSPIIQLTTIGKIANQNWMDIPKHFPFVVLDEFVVMPNHIHGILRFEKPGYRERKKNVFGPQSQNLGSVLRGYKSATKSYATTHHIEFGLQARYHDDVITSGKELERIRIYIQNNPSRWMERFGTE